MTIRQAPLTTAAILAFAATTCLPVAAGAQTSDAGGSSTHIGGSTGTGQTGTGGGSPSPNEMHAPSTPSTSGSTGTGKTSRHGRLVPRHMHAPTGPDIGGSVGTGKTGSGKPSDRS